LYSITSTTILYTTYYQFYTISTIAIVYYQYHNMYCTKT